MKNRNPGLSEKEMEIVKLLMAECETTGIAELMVKIIAENSFARLFFIPSIS